MEVIRILGLMGVLRESIELGYINMYTLYLLGKRGLRMIDDRGGEIRNGFFLKFRGQAYAD